MNVPRADSNSISDPPKVLEKKAIFSFMSPRGFQDIYLTNVTSKVDKTPLSLVESSLEVCELHVDVAGDLAKEGYQVGSILS